MSAGYLIKVKTNRRPGNVDPLAHYRPRRPRRWRTMASAHSLASAKLIAEQGGYRSTGSTTAAVFYLGRIVAHLGLALAALLLVACARRDTPTWTVELDPAGLGYWAAPAGDELRFYPSRYANPVTNPGARP